MTAAQARQYIQNAERTGEFTEEKLREAIDVLDAGTLGSGDAGYVRRAQDLLDTVEPSMTETQARRFIQQAERKPLDEIDVDRLREARQIVKESAVGLGLEEPSAKRADALLAKIEKRTAGSSADDAKPEVMPEMSEAQARQFVQQAERQDPDDVDLDRLEQAKDVLDAGTFGSGDSGYVRRIQNIINKISNPDDETREVRGIIPGSEADMRGGAPPVGPGLGAGSVADEAASAALPANLINRLYQAAARAGVSNLEVRDLIAAAKEMEAGGGGQTVQIENPVTGELEEVQMSDPNAEPVSAEELLEEQIAAWTQGAIGVPDGYVATRQNFLPSARSGGFIEGDMPNSRGSTGGSSAPGEVVPRYFSGDHLQMAGMPPERIVQIQRQFEQAGLIDMDGYYAGVWDESTSAAMSALMGMANASGKTWEQQLDFLQRNLPESVKEQRNRDRAQQIAAESFIASPYMKPDYATLAQDMKSVFRQRLGREPSDSEMSELSSAMSAAYRQEYEQETVPFERAQYDAEQAFAELVEADLAAGGTGEGLMAPSPRSVPGVDPIARFGELFDERFGSELNFIEGQEDTQQNMDNVYASLLSMNRMING